MSGRKICFCATCVALAAETGLIKVFRFPFAGSVTLCSMLFMVLPGWFYGPGAGFACGLVIGILNFILGPYYVTLPQFLFDYIFAFAIMGVSGFFRKGQNGLIKGYAAAVIGRWLMASIAGLIWVSLGSVAWDGWAPLPYTMVYNGTYIFSEAVITIILLCIPAVKKALGYVKELAVK